MPQLETISLTIECGERTAHVEHATLKHWQTSDGIKRAALGGLCVLILAAVMMPIPIVHFGAIPVLLFGLPLVIIILYRLFKSGTDLDASFTCPECDTTRRMTRSAATWPVNIQCLGCQKHLSITRKLPPQTVALPGEPTSNP